MIFMNKKFGDYFPTLTERFSGSPPRFIRKHSAKLASIPED